MEKTLSNSQAPESHTAPLIELPPEVYRTIDDEQVFNIVLDELKNRGINDEKVIFTGFDDSELGKSRSIGERLGTYGVTKNHILESLNDNRGLGKHSPLTYIANATKPAIGVFDTSNLIGSHDEVPGGYEYEIASGDLSQHNDLIYWRTKDNSPLDSALLALFVFKN